MDVAKQKEQRKKESRSAHRKKSNLYRRMVLMRATESLLGKKVDRVEFPGGKNRESIRLLLQDNTSVIATRRANMHRARTEVRTLSSLNKHNAPVPSEQQYQSLISAALDSMVCIHTAATKENLESSATALGNEIGWIKGLINRPAVIGEYLNVKAPVLDLNKLVKLLAVKQHRFVKWDKEPIR